MANTMNSLCMEDRTVRRKWAQAVEVPTFTQCWLSRNGAAGALRRHKALVARRLPPGLPETRDRERDRDRDRDKDRECRECRECRERVWRTEYGVQRQR